MGDGTELLEAQNTRDFAASFTEVVASEATAVQLLAEIDPEVIARACDLIYTCERRVICTGMGKSGHIARQGSPLRCPRLVARRISFIPAKPVMAI